MDFCPSIKNIILLDSEGKRVAVKYYSDDWPSNNSKESFEKAVFTKTQKTNARTEAEIAMLENHIVVYKFVQDLHFYVTGSEDENELILASVIQGFCDAVGILLRGNVDKKEALENLDLILLCIDEIVDGGIVLETDANNIASKVASHSIDSGAPLSKQDDIDTVSMSYDTFLSKFPLCHWHLKKYAYHKAKLCGIHEAIKIYERGVGVSMFSVGFWVDYFTFGTTCFADPGDVRRLFGRAFSYVGKDYFCHALWDEYMKYELNQQGWDFLAQSYIQVLRFPTKKLHFYYDNFKQFVVNLEEEMEYKKNHNVEVEQLTVSCAKKISRDEIATMIKDLLNSSDKSLMCKALDRYRYMGEEFYKEACQLNEKIKFFETNIRRRFFCVTPLDEDQLNNWHLYLDFVEKQENLDWAVKLYERCLIPCANYPEFWIRYVDYLESKRGHELAISALDRATQIFLKGVPEIHLFSARFKEHIGDVNGARASLLQCDTKTDSSFLEKVATHAGMERRLGNFAEASAIYEVALKTATTKQKMHILPKLYSQYAQLTFMMTGSADAARDVLINGIRKVPNCKFLLEELIKFAMTHEGAGQLNIVDSIIADAISPGLAEYDGMNVKDQEMISCLFIEFVNLCGTVHDIREAWNRHAKLFPQCLRSSVTYKHCTSGNSSINMVSDKKEGYNPAVQDQPSQNLPSVHPMQLQIHKGVFEFPMNHDIHRSQVMEKQSSQKDCNSKAKETEVAGSSKIILLSNKGASRDGEPASKLSHQYREDKQGPVNVSANLANQSKGNALSSQDLDHDFSCQFGVEKPGPMDVCSEFINRTEENALGVHESAIELIKLSGTTDPVEASDGHSSVIGIHSELDYEIKHQKQTVSLDSNSKEKQYRELIPLSRDENETRSNASERDASVIRQNLTTNMHSDLKEPSRTGKDSISLDRVVPVPGHASSGFREQEKEQEHQVQQSFPHHPANELDSKILMNQGNAELNSATENNIQALGATTNHEFSASTALLSTASATQMPIMSSPLVAFPQQNMPQSTMLSTQHPALAHQNMAMNQMLQYHYHQQHLVQQEYQHQLHMQQSFLQLQHQYMNHQQYQLQPQQQNQLHVQLAPQQYYVQDQQQQQQQQQQQITSFQPFHQSIQHYQQNQQIEGHQQSQHGQQSPQLQELAYHINQVGYQQHATAQGQQILFPQYQHYHQGYLHQQQQQLSQEGHLHIQEHLHQHPDQKQLDEQLQKHQANSKQNLTQNMSQNQQDLKQAPPDHDVATESSKSPHL